MQQLCSSLYNNMNTDTTTKRSQTESDRKQSKVGTKPEPSMQQLYSSLYNNSNGNKKQNQQRSATQPKENWNRKQSRAKAN
jgi:hypothetical protein